jgi:hypothetical protein
MNRLFSFLLIAVFVKQLFWVGLVPLWHFPDEQAHFAQVQNVVEPSFDFSGSSSDEIAISEQLLGTFRDSRGRNEYTLRPWYNIEYSNTINGVHEAEIRNISTQLRSTRQLQLNEATSYPFLYYSLSSVWYYVTYYGSLIDRVFVTRLFSAVLMVGVVFLAVKIGEKLFAELLIHYHEWRMSKKNEKQSNTETIKQKIEIEWQQKNNKLVSILAITLGILVGFHPMLSFVGAGVNSDILFVFWFTLLVYGIVGVVLPDVSKGVADEKNTGTLFNCFIVSLLRWRYWLIVLVSLVGGFLTKQQMAIGVVVVGCVLLSKLVIWFIALYRKRKERMKNEEVKIKNDKARNSLFIIHYSLFFFLSVVSLVLIVRYGEVYRIMGFLQAGPDSHDIGLFDHVKWTLMHTYREVLPWYWGVFKWLGVTLPRWVNRVQMGLLSLSCIGVFVFNITQVHRAVISKRFEK